MKKIILFCSVGLIVFSSDCFAMHAKHSHSIDEEKLTRHLRKLFIDTPHLRLESETESSQESQSSQEDFTPAPSWQDESLLEPQAKKENTPPNPSMEQTQERNLQEVARQVDAFLVAQGSVSQKKHPLSTRGQTFCIYR